ncbi:unnamed protein product [Paramecium pentaurelia]|uniref:Uncharacterized protein n=1 Tax=Paramecium pentaurelia TaxID=43138 RepID=A0A8S1WDD4_9CILI|nr:unnamed protein product [Paramecium pentaurelia]
MYDIYAQAINIIRLTGKDLFPGVKINLFLILNNQQKIDLTPLQMKKNDQSVIQLNQKLPRKRSQKKSLYQFLFKRRSYLKVPSIKGIGIQIQQTTVQKNNFLLCLKKFQTTQFQIIQAITQIIS